MSNHTILECNTLAGFEHDDTKALYLRGSQSDEIKAFYMADKWEKYLHDLKSMLAFAVSLHKDNPHIVKSPEDITEEVMNFIKERHYRSYFPQN